jgi:[acyl-carrier-protein] S-malonyltransferase
MGETIGTILVFPGQGSQHVGMGKELFEQFDEAKRVFFEAEEVLGLPLRQWCFSGPEEKLKLTEYTQPAILTVSVAALRVLEAECGTTPSFVAGHSLGEYSALVCVGALHFRDAVKVVRERGRLMQEAVPEGEGMMVAVLGLEAAAVQQLCDEACEGDVVVPANFNGGGQIVVAGNREAVLRVKSLARDRGAKKVVELPVSAPFHSPLMRPASEGLRKTLEDVAIHPFSVGVVSNVEATVNLDPERVKPLLVEQVVRPVQWEETIKHVAGLGCNRALEVGPGRVLCGLIKRITPGMETKNVAAPGDLEKTVADSSWPWV